MLKITELSNILASEKNKDNNKVIKFGNSNKKLINKSKKLSKSEKIPKSKNC